MKKKSNKLLLILFACIFAISMFTFPASAQTVSKEADIEKYDFSNADFTNNPGPDDLDFLKGHNNLNSLANGKSLTDIKNIVILIRFYGQDEFATTSRMNSLNYNYNERSDGLKQYIKTHSYNTVTVDSEFYPRNASDGTYLSYVDPHPITYYQKQSDSNPDGYTDEQEDTRRYELLTNAFNYVKNQVENDLTASQLDNDENGRIDSVTFLVNGKQYDGIGWSDLLWPHKYSSYGMYWNGKEIGTYNLLLNNISSSGAIDSGIMAEDPQNSNIAVIAHEFLHLLGTPDYYRYYESGDPVGVWDVMASTGKQPQNMLQYIQRNKLGWGHPITETTTTGSYLLKTPFFQNKDVDGGEDSPETALIIRSPYSSTEFFVVEYRRKTGFDKMLPGEGLIVYRVNTQRSGNASGPPDEIYVFRPNESSPTAAFGSVYTAYLSAQSGRTAIGKPIQPSATEFDNQTLFFSDGSNSGIVISNVGASGGDTISFDVTVPEIQDDYGNTFDTAYSWGFSPLAIRTLDGSLEYAADVDMVRFTAPITGTYTIYSSNITTDIKGWLYDFNRMQIAVDDDSAGDRNFKIITSLTEGQTYYLKVSHYSQNGAGTYTINFSADDYGDDFNNAHEMTLSTGKNSITGYSNFTGDVDMFKFTAPLSGTYEIKTAPVNPHSISLFNGSMEKIATYSSTSGMAGHRVKFEYDFVQGQTYYLLIEKAGQYTIDITVPDDYGNTFDTAYSWGFSPIGVKTLNGSLELATDVDMIKMIAPITGTYTIYSSNITTDIKGWLYDSNQMQIAVNDDSAGDRNFKITTSLTEGQIYYLKVSHFSQNEAGTYTVNILMDDYGNDFNSTYGLDLTEGVNSIIGYINYTDDVDMFKFAAPSSGTYKFETEPSSPHTLTLYNGSMQEIASQTSAFGMAGYSVNFEFDLVQGQTYYLLIEKAPGYTINITVPA